MTFQEYQKKMQQLLLAIPRGKVTTYKALAHALDIKGYRLVGQLLNKNSEPDKYPCYKVVKSDGTLGGFTLGCPDKIRQLRLDGIEIKNEKIIDFKEKFYQY